MRTAKKPVEIDLLNDNQIPLNLTKSNAKKHRNKQLKEATTNRLSISTNPKCSPIENAQNDP